MKQIIVFLLGIVITASAQSEPKKKEIFDQGSVKVYLMPFNTEQSDFGPSMIGDSLYFTSFSNDLKKKNNKELHKNAFYGLFCSRPDNYGNVSEKREMLPDFCKSYHNGPVAWCPATQELFITQSNYLQSEAIFTPFKKNLYNLQIIIAKHDGGIWKDFEPFPFNSPDYSVGHPAISSAGDTLIFSSNQPGGFGETDLYMSIRKNGKWEKPENLGKKINTAGKDAFPFLTHNGYLIFASSGRTGFGGLDIYYTKLNDPAGEVYHFDAPINSEYDDFSMILLPDREYAYMTSNRPGYGDDDIYKITFNWEKMNLLKLLVMDAKSLTPIPQADVAFSDIFDLKTGAEGQISRRINDEMSLDIRVRANGYNERMKTIKTGLLRSGEIVEDTVLMEVLVPNDRNKDSDNKIVIRNIYFDFNSSDLLPESLEELDRLTSFLIQNPEKKVNFTSHADSRGSIKYNQELSVRRMRSVFDYLLSKGIDSDRIEAKGYGETMPVNRCVDLVICSPQELRMNRRVEFYIPELGKSVSVDQGGKGDYTVVPDKKRGKNKEIGKNSSVSLPSKYKVIIGSYKDPSNANKAYDILKKMGYLPEIVKDHNLTTVGITYKDAESVKKGIKELKSLFPGAWIL